MENYGRYGSRSILYCSYAGLHNSYECADILLPGSWGQSLTRAMGDISLHASVNNYWHSLIPFLLPSH